MIDRTISVLVSLSLAFLVWLYARSRDQEMLDNVAIPVQVNLASGQANDYDLEVTGPTQVQASFTGPPSRMRELRGVLQRGELHVEVTLTVPEDRQNEAKYTDTVRIDAADIHAPPGVRAAVVEGRNRVPVTVRKLVERRLPVRLDYAAADVAKVSIEPASVLVRGPQDILERAHDIATDPYTPSPQAPTPSLSEVVTGGYVALVKELEGRPVQVAQDVVQVRLTLKPRQKEYVLRDVPVQFLCPAKFPLRPQFVGEQAGKITLRLLGPAGEEPPAVTAFVDLTGRKFEPGLYADEPLRLQLPKEYQLQKDPPKSASFELIAAPPERIGEPLLGGPGRNDR